MIPNFFEKSPFKIPLFSRESIERICNAAQNKKGNFMDDFFKKVESRTYMFIPYFKVPLRV